MSVPEVALAALGVLLCVGIILAVKEYITLRNVLSQQVESESRVADVVYAGVFALKKFVIMVRRTVYSWTSVFTQHETLRVFGHKYRAKVTAVWGILDEDELSKEKSTRTNIARLRRSLVRR